MRQRITQHVQGGVGTLQKKWCITKNLYPLLANWYPKSETRTMSFAGLIIYVHVPSNLVLQNMLNHTQFFIATL